MEFNCTTEIFGNNIKYISNLLTTEKVVVGYFEIDGKGFDKGETMAMSISIEDEYGNKGYTRAMMKELCLYISKKYPRIRKDQLLFIDTDASWNMIDGGYRSFWDHIGMKKNRYYERNIDTEGRGYEKKITFEELCKWCGAINELKYKSGGKNSKKEKKIE